MKHGTSLMYTKGACRCDACRTAQVRYAKRWRLDRERGIEYLVPTDEIRRHVQSLLDQGMSFRGIALTAGWKSRNSLQTALERNKVRRATHERIMAITLEKDARRFGYVDATGSARRLQALVVIGWPTRELAIRLGGRDHGTVTDITSQNNRSIRRETAERIKALYDELWDQPGPSRLSAQRAEKRGWLPPLAWDDDTIDDPAAKPHGGRWVPRDTRARAEVVEDFLDTYEHHNGRIDIAAHRLGMTTTALERALHRANADGAGISFTYTAKESA